MQEHVYDVVVLGTGAAGLTAALRAAAGGAQVGLFEKADTVSGTSAWSGGTAAGGSVRRYRTRGRGMARGQQPGRVRNAARHERLPPRASGRETGRPVAGVHAVPVRRPR